eukprot:TRINITY_DN1845_c0_g1_i1.p1 TRINITY_DN1845_c0_g1~~TRINITY_DN1845_c0_g1_i1.p1  ORF type:complete len:449 (-),score=132.69 TRINITY_DN1845_c0_g1_i1:72-1418(-)
MDEKNLEEPNGSSEPKVNASQVVKRAVDYDWGEKIGVGAFGEVRIVTLKETGERFAVKMMNKKFIQKNKKIQYVKTERDMLGICNHRGIVKLMSTFQDEDHLYYIMELCPNGEFLTYIKENKTLDLECVAFYSAQLIMAVEYLHSKGIIHRDLKPENMLLDEKFHLKLTDFGTAKLLGNEQRIRTESFVGTMEYLSPELINDKIVSAKADIWAIGCIIYQSICGRPAFRGVTDYVTMKKVMEVNFVYPENFPEIIKDLLDKILIADADQRWDLQQVKSHEFFQSIDFDSLYDQTPPTFKPFPLDLIFEDDKPNNNNNNTDQNTDIVLEEIEDESPKPQKRDLSEEEKKLAKYLQKEESIVKFGYINKKRKMSVKKRMLILTTKPRLFYVNPKDGEVMGHIELTKATKPSLLSGKDFQVTIPGRTYKLEDFDKNANEWVQAIKRIIEKL